MANLPVLSITGSDSTGKAGIQSDIKTISAMGGYALTAITSVTVQNSHGIHNIHDLPEELIVSQVKAII
ncbi:MAG: bifunctional hydroxymethylpyrimidine kinase/phosphomethylpyrimidine kinase, partial [Prevotella sp.]|nr:bifunctional hydroxymethylpyrimidine kinase/phosphomethylpyrimidine kinase [Prevotella sp.]